MKKIILKAIGRLSEPWLRVGAAMYIERLRPMMPVEIVELPEGHGGSAKPDIEKTRRIEGEALLKNVTDDAMIIALDERGREESSPEFASRLKHWADKDKPVVFLIGGSWGLNELVLKRASSTLSLGRMTLPHGLARVVLLEQLYRAAMIMRGSAYHK